jgi:hypothetical protein
MTLFYSAGEKLSQKEKNELRIAQKIAEKKPMITGHLG